jgi:hypothetical protein
MIHGQVGDSRKWMKSWLNLQSSWIFNKLKRHSNEKAKKATTSKLDLTGESTCVKF